ncbi:hypothetical protein R1sor_009520 [Riccia sorocarpa]|uniref:Reverse transcriptase domain-containing protein n=1 Tax=Riccia sorocarpa TaxID=122646 RepID=A0ABD3HYP7_9MARC
MLDFAKEFDSLRHDFIFAALGALGFSDVFIRIIRSITLGGLARVLVNNRITPEFPVARGVRQGCPLAPLLYVLVTSILLWHAKDEVLQGRIKCLRLGSSGVLAQVISAFADDTAFITETDQSTFDAIFALLDEFFLVSGCRVNWAKTKHMVIGKFESAPDWLFRLPFVLLTKTQGTRYLGVYVANKILPADSWDFIAAKLRKRAQGFASSFLNFESRTVILRFLLQSMLPFSLSLTRFRQLDFMALERLLSAFLWGNNADGLPKTSLVAWDRLANVVELGGSGVWCARSFQRALIAKLVYSELLDEDSIWRDIFWVIFCLRRFRWGGGGGFISDQRLSELRQEFSSLLSSTLSSCHGDFLDLPELLRWSFSADLWSFRLEDWILISPLSSKLMRFPPQVSATHLVLKEASAFSTCTLSTLSVRWLVDLLPLDWFRFFKGLWGAGLHRRDALFL